MRKLNPGLAALLTERYNALARENTPEMLDVRTTKLR
jgi:hypothetical protein